MKSLILTSLLLISTSAFSSEIEMVKQNYFAETFVDATSMRNAKKILDAESACLEVLRDLYLDPLKLRISFDHNGKKLFAANLLDSRLIRIFPDRAQGKTFSPLCSFELYYK